MQPNLIIEVSDTRDDAIETKAYLKNKLPSTTSDNRKECIYQALYLFQ